MRRALVLVSPAWIVLPSTVYSMQVTAQMETFMSGKYIVADDRSLLLKLRSLFPRRPAAGISIRLIYDF